MRVVKPLTHVFCLAVLRSLQAGQRRRQHQAQTRFVAVTLFAYTCTCALIIEFPLGMMDFAGKYKWNAWEGRKGMSQDDAKKKYVEDFIAVSLSIRLRDFWRGLIMPFAFCSRYRSSRGTRQRRPRRSSRGSTVSFSHGKR